MIIAPDLVSKTSNLGFDRVIAPQSSLIALSALIVIRRLIERISTRNIFLLLFLVMGILIQGHRSLLIAFFVAVSFLFFKDIKSFLILLFIVIFLYFIAPSAIPSIQELIQTITSVGDIYLSQDSSFTVNLRLLYLQNVTNYVVDNPLGLGLYYSFLDKTPNLDLGYASFIYIFGYMGVVVLIYMIGYYLYFIYILKKGIIL